MPLETASLEPYFDPDDNLVQDVVEKHCCVDCGKEFTVRIGTVAVRWFQA